MPSRGGYLRGRGQPRGRAAYPAARQVPRGYGPTYYPPSSTPAPAVVTPVVAQSQPVASQPQANASNANSSRSVAASSTQNVSNGVRLAAPPAARVYGGEGGYTSADDTAASDAENSAQRRKNEKNRLKRVSLFSSFLIIFPFLTSSLCA